MVCYYCNNLCWCYCNSILEGRE